MHICTCARKAIAYIKGGEVIGKIEFYQKHEGVLIIARVYGLPDNDSDFFAFHIHVGDSCKGEGFSKTGGHYNPQGKLHPNHAGDLPPLLSCNGKAYLAVMTNRFSLQEVIGRTAVIHGGVDDFSTQPAGNAGEKIACGVISLCK